MGNTTMVMFEVDHSKAKKHGEEVYIRMLLRTIEERLKFIFEEKKNEAAKDEDSGGLYFRGQNL